MAITEDWKIRGRAHSCHLSGEDFAEDEILYTALLLEEDAEGASQLVRRDYSELSWGQVAGQLEPYSFWRSRYEPPPEQPEDPAVQKENAESLLRRLIEEDLPATENARYILAIMLERKKVLVQTDVKEPRQEEGSESRILIYEHRHSGDVLLVRDPQLRLEEIESFQAEVSELLGKDDDKPPATPNQGSTR